MKGWLKKLAADFGGAAQDEPKPAPAPAPAPTPVAPAVQQAATPLPAAAPQTPRPVQASVADFEKARDDFFTALKKDDSATIERIAADYPGEALAWRYDEGTPLAIAQKGSSLQSFKALLALGADKEETYPGGDFPLHYAQINNQKDFFDLLLDSGADIERAFSETTFQHSTMITTTHTALATAILQGNKDAAITLMERGACVTAHYTHLRDSMSMHLGGSTRPNPSPRQLSTMQPSRNIS